MLQNRPRLTPDEKEIMMNLSVDFDEWEEQAIRRGVERGQLLVLLKLLQFKFGPLDPAVVERVQNLHDPAAVDRLAERILTATRIEELDLDENLPE
jgi:hypothetical protein